MKKYNQNIYKSQLGIQGKCTHSVNRALLTCQQISLYCQNKVDHHDSLLTNYTRIYITKLILMNDLVGRTLEKKNEKKKTSVVSGQRLDQVSMK